MSKHASITAPNSALIKLDQYPTTLEPPPTTQPPPTTPVNVTGFSLPTKPSDLMMKQVSIFLAPNFFDPFLVYFARTSCLKGGITDESNQFKELCIKLQFLLKHVRSYTCFEGVLCFSTVGARTSFHIELILLHVDETHELG